MVKNCCQEPSRPNCGSDAGSGRKVLPDSECQGTASAPCAAAPEPFGETASATKGHNMKRAIMRIIATVSVTTLLLACSGRAYGDVASPAKYKTFKGTVVKVDDKDRTLTAKGFWFWSTKTFNLGDTCKVLIGD